MTDLINWLSTCPTPIHTRSQNPWQESSQTRPFTLQLNLLMFLCKSDDGVCVCVCSSSNLWHCTLTKRIVFAVRWSHVLLTIWLCTVGYNQVKRIIKSSEFDLVTQSLTMCELTVLWVPYSGLKGSMPSLPWRNNITIACFGVSSLPPHIDTRRTCRCTPLYQAIVSDWQWEHVEAMLPCLMIDEGRAY